MQKLAWHFDFHSHKSIRINHDPDVAAMARTLREAGVEEIITFAKCHTGFAYYPTRFGTPHPRMVGDALGDVVRACKAEGIRVLAYISFGIDGEGGRRHPEWAQVHDPTRGPHITEDHFVSTCPYTPYIDELMLPMIAEILDGYPVDGFFFDTMGAMGVCHCRWCLAEYRERTGRPIPSGPDAPDWGEYGAFRRERAWRVVERVGRAITDRDPMMKVGFNWVGTVRYPETMPQGVTCLTCDYSTTGPQSLQASFHACYAKTADRAGDVMFTIINQGWGDWAPRPLAGLEQTGVTVWAHGCRPYLGDRLHPTNRLDPMSERAIRFMGGVQEAVRAGFPDAGAEQLCEVLTVIGPTSVYGEDMGRFATDLSATVPVQGMHRLLLDAGYPQAITTEDLLPDRLNGVRLVILSEAEGATPETDALLRSFVESGGRLLVAGRVPRVAGEPMGWCGVRTGTEPWQDHIYLPLWTEDPTRSPVLVHGPFHKTVATTAETVQFAIQPYDCSYGMRFGHATGPASFECSDVPAVTRLPYGDGEVWFLAAPVGSDYDRRANLWQAEWMRGLLERLVPDARVRVVSGAGTVEVVAHTSTDSTWAFLINHGGEQLSFSMKTARTFDVVPPYPVTLEVRDPAGRAPRAVTVAGVPAAWDTQGGVVRVPQVADSIWRVVRVDWE